MLDHRNRQVRELWRRHGKSEARFGTAMAIVAMLFIAGIIGAFIYTMDTNPVQTAGHQPTTSATVPPPSASPASPAMREPETTGSSGINRVPPKQDPRENEQSERPQ